MAVSRDSFVSAFPSFFRNAVGTLGLQICTTVPSFMWALGGSDSGSCACVVDALLTEPSNHFTDFVFIIRREAH